jgi:putative transcriptional regulator
MLRRILMLVLVVTALPALGNDASDMPSILLVARKDLPDPFFRDSVVLVTHRGGRTPVGVIINRPTDVPLSRAAPDYEGMPGRSQQIFFGGPVAAERLVVVYRDTAKPEDTIEILEGVFMSSSREVIRAVLEREKPVKDLRLFAGHASWAPGQLEREVARGDWYLVRADADSLFDAKPEEMWKRLERRATTKMLRLPISAPPS